MNKRQIFLVSENSQSHKDSADGTMKKTFTYHVGKYVEQELWESFVKGDESAFDALYRASFRNLYNYGMNLCHQADLVKDSIHDLYIDLWKYRTKPSRIQTIRAYQYKALRNIILKAQAQNGTLVEVESAYHFSFDNSEETRLILQETQDGQMDKLQTALQLLTQKQREVIFLKFYDQLSYEDVAHVLGISIKATYKLVGRAISFLRERMIFLAALLNFLL